MDDGFDDLLARNAGSLQRFRPAVASGSVAILTCMDARIDPLRIFGLREGEAPILRNAGARVNDDVERDMIVAHHVLGIGRLVIMAHTDCKMAVESPDAIHEAIAAAGGPDTRDVPFVVVPDQRASLEANVARIQSSPYLSGLMVGGFIYDVGTGRAQRVC